MNTTLLKIENHIIHPEFISNIRVTIPNRLGLEWDSPYKNEGENCIVLSTKPLKIEVNVSFFNKKNSITFIKKVDCVFTEELIGSIFKKASSDYDEPILYWGDDLSNINITETNTKVETVIPNIKDLIKEQQEVLEVEKINIEKKFMEIMKCNTIKELVL